MTARPITAVSLASALALAATPSAAPHPSASHPTIDPYFAGEGSWGQSYPDQWATRRVGLTDEPGGAYAIAPDPGEPVVVAVIDTGLDWHHADINWDNLWTNPGEIADNGVDDDGNGFVDDIIGWDFMADTNNPQDRDGHGTFVAGLIAGWTGNGHGIRGINPNAQIMVVKALNDFGHTRASDLAEAIYYAVDNGAQIINMSVGGPETTRIETEALEYAAARGVLVIAAAGNEGVPVEEWGIPGSEAVITVASTDFDDTRTVFSNWGPAIDIAAPGLDVLSLRARYTDTMRDIAGVEYEPGAAFVGEDRRYYRASGTSFSAPIVAGVASLVLSHRPELSAAELRTILLNSARDVGSPGVDQYTGYGIVDAAAALQAEAVFATARIDSVAVVAGADGAPAVRVFGLSQASNLASARLELGAGQTPAQWSVAVEDIGAVAEGGVLGDIPAAAFAGSSSWTLRLVVEDESGLVREARYQLNLG
ncbi:MAG: S8 family serine peptidase [Alphaproteobacteria bacterium]|nr:S8 family serine peptidase [Alphaproteobacteria bacterium]